MEGFTQAKTARRALAAAVLAAVAIVAVPGGSQAATPKLVATVGPGFTITLKSAAGKKVTSLTAGTYTIIVNDRSRSHDFRLRGPGLNKVFSSVAAVGSKSVTVKLRAGKYQFTCQPHAAAMHGAFTVR